MHQANVVPGCIIGTLVRWKRVLLFPHCLVASESHHFLLTLSVVKQGVEQWIGEMVWNIFLSELARARATDSGEERTQEAQDGSFQIPYSCHREESQISSMT